MHKKISIASLFITALPFVAFAEVQTLETLIWKIIGYANIILTLMIGIAVVMFVFYVIKYFIMADADRAKAGQYVMWSLIGFFVILSMWGLVNIIQNTFDLKNSNNQRSSWQDFTNIFPSGGTSRGSKTPSSDSDALIPAKK